MALVRRLGVPLLERHQQVRERDAVLLRNLDELTEVDQVKHLGGRAMPRRAQTPAVPPPRHGGLRPNDGR